MASHTRGANPRNVRTEKSVRERLESETVLMEERLITLRKQLENDRRNREIKNKEKGNHSSGSFWANGQMGFVTTHAQQLIKDMKNTQHKKNRKFKMLTENSLVETNNVPHPPPPCDRAKGGAIVSSPETSHSITLGNGNLETFLCERNSPIKHSLLDGCYDETESAESFKTVLEEWRNAGIETKTAIGTVTINTEVPVNRKILEIPDFKTSSTLTYFDRLMLKKYKSGSNTSKLELKSEIHENTESLNPSISQYNIFYNSENLHLEPEPTPNQGLKITEILDEDELDELGPKGVKNNHTQSDNNFKIVTQTNLSGFFLLGTKVVGEEISTNQYPDYVDNGTLILGGKTAWNQGESINSHKVVNFSSDSDSSSDCPLVDFDECFDNNSSGDDDILTLERLSNELKNVSDCGTNSGIESGTGLWAELMCHRPPTSNDFN
ncbi:Zinc finger B-box domain-containing protein 1 [Oopsacas minuta]|uniref:Zinc finger B-box domain-containing protein 1 n=1 Tax=Oopsacas minuta TaxID=111878 RepID=A0AAV7KBL5_9METZ|nr:Zinc finger B-box domain-containing protein 1 [Oopsacas minuta]